MQEPRAVDVLLAPDNVSRPLESVQAFKEFMIAETHRRLTHREDFKLRWQRTKIKIEHAPELQQAYDAVQDAQAQWDNAPNRKRYGMLLGELNKAVLTLNGYKLFLDSHRDVLENIKDPSAETPADEKTQKLVAKLQRSAATAQELEEQVAAAQLELDACVAESPQLHALTKANAAYTELQDALGLTALDQAIKEADRAMGNAATDRGSSFEIQASTDVLIELAKRLAASEHYGELAPEAMIVLQNMTLRSAKAELDFLVCVPSTREVPPPPRKDIKRTLPAISVDVVAIVEVKREPNDIGYAVQRYREYMPWFAGDETRYDPTIWVNKFYPKGHFDRPFFQLSDDKQRYYVFTADSFHSIYDPNSELPNAFHIVTRHRRLIGISSKAAGPLFSKACSDPALVLELNRQLNLDPISLPEGSEYPGFDWQQLWESLTGELSSEDVLRMYAADPVAAARIHLLTTH